MLIPSSFGRLNELELLLVLTETVLTPYRSPLYVAGALKH